MTIDLSSLFLFRGLQRLAGLGLSTSLALVLGCDSTQQVPGAEVPQSKVGGSIKGSFLVAGVKPVALSPGDLANIEGFGLTDDAQVLVGDQPVAVVERRSDRTLTFKMPEGNPGIEVVTVRKGGEQSAHLIIRLSADGEPVLIGGNLRQLCKGERFFTLSGDAVEGERDCLKEAVICTQEAQTGCLASEDFPVVDRESLAARVVSGESVAGVAGAADTALLPCQEDGAVDCIANAGFPAADKRQAVVANIAAGVTIAGVSGGLVLPPRCAEEGSTECIVGQGYAAASLAGLADKVLSTASVAGVAGSVTLPPVAEVRAGVAYGVAGTPSIGLLTLPATDDVFAGIQYGIGGSGSTGKLTLAAAANVRVSQGVFGRGGNSVTPALADCAADGAQSCVANSGYAAADVSGLAAKVVFGATVAGVSGSVHVPTPSTVLTGISVGVSGSGTVALPAPGNVRQAVAYGADDALTGTLDPGAVPVDCSSDGQISCVAVTGFPAVDLTNLASKVLSTASVAGVAGNVTLPATGKVLAATGYGVDGSSFVGTLALPPASKVLTGSGSYGDPGTPLMPSYSPDFPAAGNVLAGDTVDGAPGTLTLPPAASVLASVGPYGVGGNGSTPTLTLPATGKVLASIPYGVGGSGSTGALILPALGNVLIGTGTYGDPAAALTPSYSPDFPAAGNVLAGDTVNGVAGTLTLPATGKVLASTQYGVGGSGSTGSLTLPAASAVRAGSGTYGDPGAPVTPSYSPDFPAVANVLSSDTVDGIAGTLALPAAGDVYSGVLYGAGGLGSTGALTLPTAANVWTGQGAFGRSGNSVTPTLADCAADGTTNCVTNASFKSASMAVALAGNIKSGVTIAGVAGGYPSATYPLTGAGPATDLVSLSATVAAGGYEWWASDGTRYDGTISDAGTVTATISDQTFSSSVYRAFTVAGDADLIAGNIKSGINLFNVVGNVAPPPANCTSDGADGCVVDGTSYKAAKLSQFSPGDIKSGVTIAGVSGSLGNCGADGVAGCVVVGPTMAAAVTTGIGSKILSGSTIAGVSGNVTLPAAGKVLTGTQYGVFGTGSTGTLTLPAAAYVLSGSGSFGDPGAAVTPTLTLPVVGDVFAGIQYGAGGTSSTGTLTLASAANVRTSQGAFGRGGNSVTPTLADCASDGATGCVAVTGYKAANMTNVTEATIRSGVTIAGVTGNFPSATHPLSDASATTDLSSLAASTSAGSYEWWSSNGTRYTGTISDAGTINPTTATQTFNTSVYRTFTVAGNGNLTAANIKNGTTIFGVTGAYPSSTYPLAGADNTADLDFATFDAKIKSTVDFEWFDAAGNRYTNTGDADIAAGNLKDGISIFGTAGTLIGGPYCTGDGQTSCVTSSRYKSMDTDSTVISVWDIRKGKAAGGLTGELVFHRSMANTGNFNRTSGTGALSGVDVYDTIDDYNNGGAFPTQNPAGWYQATGANWLRNSVSDVGGGVSGVAGDGICNGSEACVYTDRLTDLSWLRDDGTTRNWESAIAYCEGLTSGGYSDWRLPTQKELMQAYTNGIWSQKAATRLDLAVSSSILYWSSSTRSYDTTYAFRVSLVSGYVWSDAKTTANYAVCVR